MNKNLKELADLSGGQLKGDGGVVICGVSEPDTARPDQICLVASKKYVEAARQSRAGAFIIQQGLPDLERPVIISDNSHLVFARIVEIFAEDAGTFVPAGIHPSAVVSKTAVIGKSVSVQAYAVIEENAVIGDNSVIFPFVYVGRETKIGRQALIYSGVSIRERVKIGDRAIIHSGAVIGNDGFGFAREQAGTYKKIRQTGTVEIGDDVEIGANACIARATLGKTRIGSGVKIDSLVQIAHNVSIGDNTIIVGQAGVSGSVVIGKNVILAGQVGIADHVTIGDNVIVEAKSGVHKDLAAGKIYFGYPAREQKEAARNLAEIQQIGKIRKRLKEIEKKSGI